MSGTESGSAAPVLVVIGPPGAGKSTVAALVAARLGVAHRDTDVDVEQVAGQSIPDIFVEQGEPHFRALERAAVVAALSAHDGVLSVGGGAVLDADTQADLERLVADGATRVLFLDVQIADAAARIGLNVSRPLLIGNPRAQWLRMMELRRPVYTRLATHVVATDDRSAEDVAAEVAALLG